MLKRALKAILDSMGFEIARKYEKKRICWPRLSPYPLTHFEDDEAFHAMYEKSQHATQMVDNDNPLRRQRLYVTFQLLRQANLNGGDVCEAGCWRGLSAHLLSQHIKAREQQVTFHMFDSFEGLSELQPVDVPNDWDQRYKGTLGFSKDKLKEQFSCPLQTVRDNLSGFSFIRYYEGWIPTRFHEIADRYFSFVHLDFGLYQPVYESFQFLYPRLNQHGIMVFNDYGSTQFPGARKAVDECLRQYTDNFFLSTASGVAFLIKGM